MRNQSVELKEYGTGAGYRSRMKWERGTEGVRIRIVELRVYGKGGGVQNRARY